MRAKQKIHQIKILSWSKMNKKIVLSFLLTIIFFNITFYINSDYGDFFDPVGANNIKLVRTLINRLC